MLIEALQTWLGFIRSRLRRRYLLPLVLVCGLCGVVVWRLMAPAASNVNEALTNGHYRLAARYLAVEAQQGDSAAQNTIANLYYLGLGVTQNFDIAAKYYFSAAQQEFADAQLNLGNLYRQGLGVTRDPMRAFAWYRFSDRNGQPVAERYLTLIAVEYTIGPLQIEAVKKKWGRLDALVKEGL